MPPNVFLYARRLGTRPGVPPAAGRPARLKPRSTRSDHVGYVVKGGAALPGVLTDSPLRLPIES